jgi:NAD(P)-dependent dehydrogenase (short-subunit alcohol dehydrogenase family)
VVVNYLQARRDAEGVARRLRASGRRAVAVQADVSSAREAGALVDRAAEAMGPPDILVNNAGMIARAATLEELDEAKWDRTLDVNLKGAYLVARAAAARMAESPGPKSVVNVSSIAGVAPLSSTVAYGAAKAGLLMLTRHLARELGPRVRVNAVAPGFIRTDFHRGSPPERLRRVVGRTPLGRWGGPEDVADAVAFLASDRAAFITGQTLVVDGGLTYSWF